jgi:NADH-quinone oxidoreductase subunit M
VGLPLLNGFVGEFLVLNGAFQDKAIYGILGASGVIWGACYLLWMYQKVFYGQITREANKKLPDLDGREQISLWPVAVMAIVMGVVSPYWMKSIGPAVAAVHSAPNTTTASQVSTASPAMQAGGQK